MKRLLSICFLFILTLFVAAIATAAESPATKTSKPSPQAALVILRGTLIDATGKPPIQDSVVVIRGDRIQAVGKRGDVSIPAGSRVIDAKGKTILPGFIDGHCHLRDFMGELYLNLGVTTCPDISQNDDYWVAAIRDGTNLGKIRGPRIWATGKRLLGPPPPWGRRVGFGYLVQTPEEARKIVREKKQLGMEIIKTNEFVSPEVLKAAADEANQLGLPTTCHCLDVLLAAEAGYTGVEHHWAPGMTSIADVKKRWKVHEDRNAGVFDTPELPYYYETENFDAIIKAMVEKNVSYSATIATHFRPLSPSAAVFKARELSILNHPNTKYFPPFLKYQTDGAYSTYEKMTPEQMSRVKEGYGKITDFMRRYVKAGGLLRTGSDPNNILPGLGIHIEMKMFVEAGLTPMQAIQASTINVAKMFRKDKDFGTVEAGKVADLVIIDGDPLKEIWNTQKVSRVILNGNEADTSFHAAYKNPIVNTRADERVPDITEISPASIPESSQPAILKVRARRNFEPYFKVTLNGKEIDTKFISETELHATIPPDAMKKPGTYVVTVVNPGDFAARSSLAYLIIHFKK